MTNAPGVGGSVSAPSPTPRRRRQVGLLLGVAILVLAVDQLTKNWVVNSLPEGKAIPVLGEFLLWHFVRNPGAAFSMASGATWIFTILAAVVVVVILWQMRRLRSIAWALFLALLLGGVLGNLTDRLTRAPGFPVGHVIDFISTPWLLPAIYNIADIAIVVAMGLFILVSLLGVPIDGSPRATRSTREDARHDGDSAIVDERSPAEARSDVPPPSDEELR